MDLNYKTVNLFPSSIHSLGINDFDNYKDQLVKEIYQERDENPIGRKISNHGGWQSNQININYCKSETLKEIIIRSLCQLEPIFKNVSMNVQGWMNINGPGNFNVKHDHPRSNLSGVLWIKTPKNSGNLVFTSPQLFNKFEELYNYRDEFKYDTKSYMTYYFTPTEGRILLFPSSLEHEVEENKSNEDRISYSFNIELINEE